MLTSRMWWDDVGAIGALRYGLMRCAVVRGGVVRAGAAVLDL